MTISKEDLEARIAIAREATPGPWSIERKGSSAHLLNKASDEMRYHTGQEFERLTSRYEAGPLFYKNAAHIAANDPQAVIALCEELLAAREEIKELQDSIEWHAARSYP